MRLFAYNPSLQGLEKTYLMGSTLTGATAFSVKNSNRFGNGDRVLVGSMSRERSEMLFVTADPTATLLTLGAAKFPHDADDPVYALKYDKIRVWRSTTGESGSYSVIATIDVDVDAADGRTWYEDLNSLPSYWYTISYYDSVDGDETDQSVPIQSTGYPDNSVGDTLMQVIGEVNDTDFRVFEIPQWIGIMNNISKDLYKQAKRPYRFLKRNIPLNVEANDDSVPFPDLIWKIDYVEVNQYNAGATPLTFRPKRIDLTTMRFRQSRMILPSDYVYEIAFDDTANTLLFNPRARTERIGAFNFHMYKKFSKFSDMNDMLETPDNLVYQYGMKRAYYLRKMDDDAKYGSQFQEFDKMYQAEIRMMQREKTIEADAPASLGPDKKRYMQFGAARRYPR